MVPFIPNISLGGAVVLIRAQRNARERDLVRLVGLDQDLPRERIHPPAHRGIQQRLGSGRDLVGIESHVVGTATDVDPPHAVAHHDSHLRGLEFEVPIRCLDHSNFTHGARRRRGGRRWCGLGRAEPVEQFPQHHGHFHRRPPPPGHRPSRSCASILSPFDQHSGHVESSAHRGEGRRRERVARYAEVGRPGSRRVANLLRMESLRAMPSPTQRAPAVHLPTRRHSPVR